MLTASFSTLNAFLVSDVKRIPTENATEVRIAIREYGQLTFVVSDLMLPAGNTLSDGEIGYPLSDFIGSALITGNFTRVRKSPTAAPSLVFTIQSIG